MRIFLTGATGFIGSAVVPELLAAGHQVIGLTRSDAGARALADAGAESHRGALEDLESLRSGAAQADGVIHTAFDHDFSNYAANCEKDGRVVAALGEALKGSDRPLVITSGTALGNIRPGQPASEDAFDAGHALPRIASELAGAALLEGGLNVSVVRLSQVHDTVKQGLVSPLVELARRKGVSAFLGDGGNRWPAAHVLDLASLYRLVLERAEPGARYHAVAEEGVPARAIAEAIGRGLGVAVASLTLKEAEDHFGWLAGFVGLDMPASSAWTRARLGWHPTGPGLISDLAGMRYSDDPR
ncbi:SDR family oxidoreductase [Methylobacterium sp. R2-1]|uniref:SDR family oxidoreductase n=1 Tax=Methylobacterium sp. R2-1 TaxID=2587064 RepID=UPI001615E2C7|nr:SDR family oxidoreductase [Methylobacterium sp. R2-1]MBB2964767.1 nucleoside-diphosphate-sugar epimerase [Methylobacterium sp. R2-1]